MEKLSYTLESYLDAVHELSVPGGGARLTDIARRMGVAKSTASAAMSSLALKGLVENERYRHVTLTGLGEIMARDVNRKHEAIRSFLIGLGIDEATAETDACAIEHVISDRTVRAMRARLGAGGAIPGAREE